MYITSSVRVWMCLNFHHHPSGLKLLLSLGQNPSCTLAILIHSLTVWTHQLKQGKGRRPTTTSTNLWHQVWPSNPGHLRTEGSIYTCSRPHYLKSLALSKLNPFPLENLHSNYFIGHLECLLLKPCFDSNWIVVFLLRMKHVENMLSDHVRKGVDRGLVLFVHMNKVQWASFSISWQYFLVLYPSGNQVESIIVSIQATEPRNYCIFYLLEIPRLLKQQELLSQYLWEFSPHPARGTSTHKQHLW